MPTINIVQWFWKRIRIITAPNTTTENNKFRHYILAVVGFI